MRNPNRPKSIPALSREATEALNAVLLALSGDDYSDYGRERAQEYIDSIKIKASGLPYKAEQEVEAGVGDYAYEEFDDGDGYVEYEVTIPFRLTFWGKRKAEKRSALEEAFEKARQEQ